MHTWAVPTNKPWNEQHGGRPVTEPVTPSTEPQGGNPCSAPTSPIRITMPTMVTHTSKVVLREDPTPQRLSMLEQKCRAQEAMLLEKDTHLQKLKDSEQLRLRVMMLEHRCRSHEAILSEKEAQLQKLKEGASLQPRSPMLEQRLRLQQAELHERDSQIHKLTEIVEQAKSALQQLAIEADSENNELQAEIVAMKEKLDCVADETRSRQVTIPLCDSSVHCQEVDQLDQKLAESEAMCQALRWELDAITARSPSEAAVASGDPASEPVDREVTALRAEAVRLRELQQLQWQQNAADAQRFRAELTALRAALRREGVAVDGCMELTVDGSDEALEEAKMETAQVREELEASRGLVTQASSEAAALRESLAEVEAALEAERRARRQAIESLHQCEEVAARLMAERNATKAELEEFTVVTEAFKKQAASEMRESRWTRFTLRLLRLIDGSTSDELRDSWSHGLQGWQAFASVLTEKINSRPTAVFAQEIAGHCARGDKALQALDDKIVSQGLQMAAFADKAMQEFSQARKLWEARLKRERMLRLAAEEDLSRQSGEQDPSQLADKPKAVDLVASLQQERSEVERLRKQLAEAEQTIGQLVVQSLEPTPKKAAASKTPSGSLRSRARSSLT